MFTSAKFRNFKSLKDFTVPLKRVNILVGPNNAGKSSVLDAFRALSTAQAVASRRNPSPIRIGRETLFGYEIPVNQIPISLENIHSDYRSEQETSVTYQIDNGNRLKLHFLDNSRCILVADTSGRQIQNTLAYLDSRWTNLSDKLTVVGGKQFLSSMNVYLQRELGISITATQILRTLVLPADCDLRRILVALDSFAATH